jgi:hypothetical protein
VTDTLEEASENIAAISISAKEKNLPVIQRTTTTTSLLAVRNTQNEEVEDEEEEGGDISMKIHTREQALHCISEIMQFAIDSYSSSLLELLYAVKDCIHKD